jgi:hypothetical protein
VLPLVQVHTKLEFAEVVTAEALPEAQRFELGASCVSTPADAPQSAEPADMTLRTDIK